MLFGCKEKVTQKRMFYLTRKNIKDMKEQQK